MRRKQYLTVCLLAAFVLPGVGLADDHGRGKHHGTDGDDDRGRQYYSEHDRDEMRDWYRDHDSHLPPGLAKRDRLTPGLEGQLRVHGTLPPGLRKKMNPLPEELERRLPSPPTGCVHVVVGGHVVLVNRSTYLVLDIFHFER